MADYTVKQHDHGTTIEVPLEQWDRTVPDPVTGTPGSWIPVPGLDAAIQLRLLLRSQTAIGPGDPATVVIIIGLAEYGGEPGLVIYTWDADDLDYAGVYDGEIEITRPGGIVETVPNGSDGAYFTVEIVDDLS